MSLNILHGCDHILVSVPLCVYRGNSPPHSHSRRTHTHSTITIVHSFIINIIIALGGCSGYWPASTSVFASHPSPTRTWCPSSFSLSHEWAWQSHHHHHHKAGDIHASSRVVVDRHSVLSRRWFKLVVLGSPLSFSKADVRCLSRFLLTIIIMHINKYDYNRTFTLASSVM